jgi:hypothetical protein
MIEMARAARVPDIGSQYDSFLYATICAEANGSLLSVLSAMARMNLDPWQEAEILAGLPVKAATNRLATLIAAVPGGVPGETGLIAARLVKLLPSQSRSVLPSLPPRKDLSGFLGLLKQPRTALYLLFILIVLVLASMWVTAHQSPSAAPNAASISSTTVPRSTPPSH